MPLRPHSIHFLRLVNRLKGRRQAPSVFHFRRHEHGRVRNPASEKIGQKLSQVQPNATQIDVQNLAGVFPDFLHLVPGQHVQRKRTTDRQ